MSTSKKLQNKFVFWYHIIDTSSDQDYKAQIKKLAQFETLEDFWSIFQYLKKPDDYKQPIEIQLFKDGITPMWEDENNKKGGRISLKLRKEFSNLVWEELIFAFIGGYFNKEIKDEINGLVINCKKDFNTLQLWTRNFDSEINKGIENNLRELLNIPKEVILEIKSFNVQHYQNNYNNNYNNYNKQGNYMKKRQNNNYYKKRESYENNKENKYYENKEGNNQVEKEVKDTKEIKEEEGNDEGKKEEKIVEKKESKEITNDNGNEKKEEKKEVKKKKKKKVEK
jgi:translation initiation factor 4E